MPTPISCIAKEPLIKFEDIGTASILDYQLPESKSFDSVGYVKLKIDIACWTTFATDAPPDNFWDLTAKMSASQILELIQDDIDGISDPTFIINGYLLHQLNLVQVISAPSSSSSGVPAGYDPALWNMAMSMATVHFERGSGPPATPDQVYALALQTYQTLLATRGRDGGPVVGQPKPGATSTGAAPGETIIPGIYICGVNVNDIVSQVQRGRRPIIIKDFYGNYKIKFIPEPASPKPELTLLLHYRTNTYLGNYGAGRVLKTTSLLPGEKSTITIRTFKHIEQLRAKSENVIDSFNQNSASELQSTIENLSVYDTSNQSSSTSSHEGGGGGSFGINLGFISIGGGGGGGSSGSSTTNSAVAQHMQNLNRGVSSQVNSSSMAREINVKVNTSETIVLETEELIVREIQNINWSRVLNFVFRQLIQDHITITYLHDVSVMFSNGYPESKRIVKLPDLGTLLNLVNITSGACVDDAATQIYTQLCNIRDYEDTPTSIIEPVDETLTDCINLTPPINLPTWVRIQPDLSQTYTEGSLSFTVPGLIMSVNHYSLLTDSVIADALLGQGEALDCYNSKLQETATQAAQQKVDVIDAITDPIDKANKYKKVFGDCCDVAQSGGGCGCGSGGDDFVQLESL